MGNILWLASYPKSGNTWLRAFLANLVANRSAPLLLSELPHYCEDESSATRYTQAAGQLSTSLTIDQVSALRPVVQAAIAAGVKATVFVKSHNYWGGFGEHLLHNPEVTAGAICVVRNPLDVAVSMTHHFGLSVNEAIDFLGNEATATENESRWVPQLLGSWSTHVASWADIEHPSFLVVRYEDLIEKPAKPFARIAKLVGVSDRPRIERAIRHSSFQTLARIERSEGFMEASEKSAARFFRVGRAQEWRQVLSRDQVGRIVDRHRNQMARFKYIPLGYG